MTKDNIKSITKNIVFGFLIFALVFAYLPSTASAAQITARSVAIGSSVASASTTYNFLFTAGSATTIKSVGFAACTTASGACTTAPGFSASSSALASSSNLGSGGTWTVNTSTAGQLRMTNTSNTGAPSAGITANFTSVQNPSATNSTFYMRITTYSDAAWSTPIDNGTVASSTAGQVTITASVDETLTFTLASSSISLGTLSKTFEGTGTSSMTVGTNASSGYTVSYSGATLTSGSNVIDAMAAQGASVTNSKQFGLNLRANTTPSVGTNVSGAGSGTAVAAYNTPNQFKFNTGGEVVASAATSTDDNVFTTSYIANINSSTAAGSYTTTLTYTATANF